MPVPRRSPHDLYKLFASVKTEREATMLLLDILTPAELASVAERWRLIQALDAGMTQRDINKKLKVSISKITRGSHMLKHGSGGFAHFLKKLRTKKR